MKTKQVIVTPYDEKWPGAFRAIREELCEALGGSVLSIQHVGSTSVPGLAAKPIIDIDVVINGYGVFDDVESRLVSIGYIHEGDLGIEGREAFKYHDKPHLMAHHLYVCPRDSEELRRHIAFRDYLRAHPEDRQVYGDMKLRLAERYPRDIDSYMREKAPYVQDILRKCGYA